MGGRMRALMQQRELNVSDIIRFAARYHTAARVTTRRADGSTVAYTYPQIEARAARLTKALRRRGIVTPAHGSAPSPRNDHRHLEI